MPDRTFAAAACRLPLTRMHALKNSLRYLLGSFLMLAGANHFRSPAFYVSIMPPYLPWHLELVYASGVAELLVGALLLFRRSKRLAAWAAVALMIAVFPANLQMAFHPDLYPQFSQVALWLRLPLQGVLIVWAYWFTRPDAASREHPATGTPLSD